MEIPENKDHNLSFSNKKDSTKKNRRFKNRAFKLEDLKVASKTFKDILINAKRAAGILQPEDRSLSEDDRIHARLMAHVALRDIDKESVGDAYLMIASDTSLDYSGRRKAAEALKDIDKGKTGDAYLSIASDTNLDCWDRMNAAGALKDIDKGKAGDAYLLIVSDTSQSAYNRMDAAGALKDIDKGKAGDAYLSIASDTSLDCWDRMNAAETLRYIDKGKAEDAYLSIASDTSKGANDRMRAITELISIDKLSTLEFCVSVMKNDDSSEPSLIEFVVKTIMSLVSNTKDQEIAVLDEKGRELMKDGCLISLDSGIDSLSFFMILNCLAKLDKEKALEESLRIAESDHFDLSYRLKALEGYLDIDENSKDNREKLMTICKSIFENKNIKDHPKVVTLVGIVEKLDQKKAIEMYESLATNNDTPFDESMRAANALLKLDKEKAKNVYISISKSSKLTSTSQHLRLARQLKDIDDDEAFNLFLNVAKDDRSSQSDRLEAAMYVLLAEKGNKFKDEKKAVILNILEGEKFFRIPEDRCLELILDSATMKLMLEPKAIEVLLEDEMVAKKIMKTSA